MCRYLRRWLAPLALAIAALGEGPSAWGAPEDRAEMPRRATEPRDAARALANRAADAIARGEHEQAEELLRQAYEQYPAPTIAVLHARTLVHLQRLATALNVYERATLASLGPDAPDAFRRAAELAEKEAAALRPRVPRLQIVVRGPAAAHPDLKVTLDGRVVPVAQQGRWIWVDPGRRIVRAELDGKSSEQVVRIEERQSIVIDVSEPDSARLPYRALTWSSLGIGVAGLATGIATGVVATSAHARAAESCPGDRCVEGSSGAEELSRFKTYRSVSTVGYAIGAVGLSAFGFLLVRGALEGPDLALELEPHSARLSFGGVL
jgi:hypothetical protein